NVVFIVLDTLRADHLGCYGHPGNLTPAMDRLAARATRYAQAVSTASWTLSSHASMFTGHYPISHGAHFFAHVVAQGDNARPLEQRFVTLGEVFATLGYQTGYITANVGYLGPFFGLNQGFQHQDIKADPGVRIAE